MTTTKYTSKFLNDLVEATEYCTRCDDFFRPEDGWTNAYGSFHCDECSFVDRKLK